MKNEYLAIILFQSNICSEGGAAMSRDWTQEELQNASKAMKVAGHLGYEEFCEQLDKNIFTAYCKDTDNNLIKISGRTKIHYDFRKGKRTWSRPLPNLGKKVHRHKGTHSGDYPRVC